MSDPTIRAALEKAAKRLCICDGECFETRHGMMHGPCERRMGKTAAAIAAFNRELARQYRMSAADAADCEVDAYEHERMAALIEAAAVEQAVKESRDD